MCHVFANHKYLKITKTACLLALHWKLCQKLFLWTWIKLLTQLLKIPSSHTVHIRSITKWFFLILKICTIFVWGIIWFVALKKLKTMLKPMELIYLNEPNLIVSDFFSRKNLENQPQMYNQLIPLAD